MFDRVRAFARDQGGATRLGAALAAAILSVAPLDALMGRGAELSQVSAIGRQPAPRGEDALSFIELIVL